MSNHDDESSSDHELPWGKISIEAVFWIILCSLWLLWENCPLPLAEARITALKSFWYKIIPHQPHNEGWGSLSYVSCVTGLNFAIVKLQHFLKSQEDVQKRWIARAVVLAARRLPGLGVDDVTATQLRDKIRQLCETSLESINTRKMKDWAFWSRFAIRMSIIGLLCMAFQYTAGFLMLFMIAPVIATWYLSRSTRTALFQKMEVVDDLIPDFLEMLKMRSAKNEERVKATLQEARKNTETIQKIRRPPPENEVSGGSAI